MYTILLVDDEADLLFFMKKGLAESGFRVICAHDGQEAVRKVKAHNPDVIVTDVMMPGMDGLDFYEILKADLHTKAIPVIISTVKDTLEESFRELGVNEFIAKPVDIPLLVEKIKKCVEPRETA